MTTTTSNRRCDVRFRTKRDAFIEVNGIRVAARIENLSAGGAYLRFHRMPEVPVARFRLVLMGRSSDTVMEATACLVHERTGGWGVQFEDSLKRGAFVEYLFDTGYRADDTRSEQTKGRQHESM